MTEEEIKSKQDKKKQHDIIIGIPILSLSYIRVISGDLASVLVFLTVEIQLTLKSWGL
jgi:hypothetical protein